MNCSLEEVIEKILKKSATIQVIHQESIIQCLKSKLLDYYKIYLTTDIHTGTGNVRRRIVAISVAHKGKILIRERESGC